jgi:formylglycine-generating enzyme required for sulfatase activity
VNTPDRAAGQLARSLDLVSVPAGTVLMGTPTDEIDLVVRAHADLDLPRSYFAKEAPRHEAYVPAFRMLRTPVTLSQWAIYADVTGARALTGRGDLPVDELGWAEARAFCGWLTSSGVGMFDLPVEEQWERAARGSDDREYPWGARFEASRANMAEAGIGARAPVGAFPAGASPFGLLDMAGNVDEWTASVYAPYQGAPADVPAVETWAVDPHITRGGGWIHHRDLARCARRHAVYPPGVGAGFRIVMV